MAYRNDSGRVAQDATPYLPRRLTLPGLREAAEQCQGCDLYRDATQSVVGDGPRNARLMLVGEQPGDAEDREGAPFVGPAGRVLDQALEAAGIERGQVFVTNAVKHFRFEQRGKRRIHKAPTVTQIRACKPWLTAELELVAPSGVVLLGVTAGKSVLGPDFRLGVVRGQIRPWDETTATGQQRARPDWMLATIHPSAVLRATNRDEMLAGLITDLTTAREHLTPKAR